MVKVRILLCVSVTVQPMDKTQEKLKEETKKWLEQMENVEAYRDDTRHFLEEEDYIRAWESVIYAWGILETLERLGKFD